MYQVQYYLIFFSHPPDTVHRTVRYCGTIRRMAPGTWKRTFPYEHSLHGLECFLHRSAGQAHDTQLKKPHRLGHSINTSIASTTLPMTDGSRPFGQKIYGSTTVKPSVFSPVAILFLVQYRPFMTHYHNDISPVLLLRPSPSRQFLRAVVTDKPFV